MGLTFDQLIENVRGWAEQKDLLKKENAPKQIMKVVEEFGETCSAINKDQPLLIVDGLGDTFVTLIILTMQMGYDPAEVLEFAWEEIKYRKGKTIGGVFIKE
jgi:phosphoribosyl-ATP pyrophosphohydrolase